jgi:hypothetical protein
MRLAWITTHIADRHVDRCYRYNRNDIEVRQLDGLR